MDANAVAEEITARLRQFEPRGYYIHPHPPEALTPPCLIVSYPKGIHYDETYGRGMDKIEDWEIVAAVSGVSLETSRKRILTLASGGLGGVKAVLEAPGYTSLDEIVVHDASFDAYEVAGVSYISCTWLVDIWGTGRV
jgi:hypothetical protein